MSFDSSGSEQSPAELRPALRWWQTYLTEISSQQAEQIRNEPLQELHALSRQIELVSLTLNAAPTQQLNLWLAELQGLYRTLESVSNQLAAPQLSDLHLAIQQRIDDWQAQFPPLRIQLDCQTAIEENDVNGLVLQALEALLSIALHDIHGAVNLWLCQRGAQGILSVSIPLRTPSQNLPASLHQQLAHLKISFSYLSQGDYQQEFADLKAEKYLNCSFIWPIAPSHRVISNEGTYSGVPL